MTIDKAKLKALAEAASAGDATTVDLWYLYEALKPAAVLALLAEISRIEIDAAYVMAGSRTRSEVIDQLKAENESLLKDSENWQTVQRAMEQLKSDEQGAAIWSACSRILISLASDLNSARSVVTEEGVTKDGAEIGDWRVTVERLAVTQEANHDN